MKNVAIITGASSGIGRELAKLAAADGYDPVLIARSEDKLMSLKKELEEKYKVQAMVLVKDMSKKEAPREIYDTLKDREVEILINNAGFADFEMFHKANWDKLESMMQLNMRALTELCHLFIPLMLKRKHGKILNLSSTAAFQPGPLMAVYYATKAYVQSFSEAIANELRDTGVNVTALCPGPTSSGFQSAANMEGSKILRLAKLDSSQSVAEFGYKAMQRGEVLAVPGLMNKVGVSATRFIPRKALANLVRKISEKK